MNSSLKHTLFEQCQQFVDGRLNAIQQTISEIQESLSSETKSSAGDKHETGRAMLQLEREKAGQQLAEIQKLNQLLSKIDLSKPSKTIGLGSLVFTTQAHYFIIISAGQLQAQDQQFYAISANTPIAKLLLGKQAGDLITFSNQEFTIIEVR
ncbi:GreA/GreB family elongation factor [Psychroserpens algicola]|uniref:GreA/GreB family elongation factor n=1 Tax=Psychroserpens algicola TaxID=1719034 RepID=A0ABT0H7Q2_9FLAO|nr:GreA/GreB family elongation factor [Psychroserpens algicola]MCK8480381.1 GreA/GreB family elongation factor [Psychroserpens algicola]